MSREEIEEMLGLDELRQTKVYQEAVEEGKLEGELEVVPALLERGLTIKAITEILNIEVEQVRGD